MYAGKNQQVITEKRSEAYDARGPQKISRTHIRAWGCLAVVLPVFPTVPAVALLLILAVLGIGVYALLSLLFPGKTEYVKEPEKPVASGNADIDALMTEGRRAVDEMKGLKSSIKNAEVCSKIEALIDVTDRIFKDLLDDPSDYPPGQAFFRILPADDDQAAP